MLRIRPEHLELILEVTRSRLAEAYLDDTFAPDLTDPTECDFVAQEVEVLMRGLQVEMGFGSRKADPELG
jgi:hypothetical protein